MVQKEEIRFFIIDDDSDDRDFFQIALDITALSYKLTIAESATQALKMLQESSEQPDYIFLDLNMPLVSGKEFLKILRSNPIFTQIPVIIFSTSSYNKDIEDTLALGANHFLCKTPDIDRLSEIIISIVAAHDLPYILI